MFGLFLPSQLYNAYLGHVKLIIWFSDNWFLKNVKVGREFSFSVYLHVTYGKGFSVRGFFLGGGGDVTDGMLQYILYSLCFLSCLCMSCFIMSFCL